MSKRNRISDNQRKILDDFYGKGMVGTGAMYREMVEKAAADTGLTKAQVEKWIGNQKRKRSQETLNDESDVTLKRVKAARGPHSYNLFCAEFFKTDECKGLTYEDKNKRASEKWKLQTKEEKEKYENSAKAFKELDVKVSELSEEQRKKLIERHRKKLLEEIMVLEDLGCQASVLYLDVSGEVFHVGSRDGTSFLAANQDISLKFREYFGSDKHHFSVSDVQDLFNKKYSEACGKKGYRVPYLKGGFEIHGLPEGIIFKKPYNYGRLQLRQIMLAADKIYFTVANNQPHSDEPDGCLAESGPSNPQPTGDILPVLTKIAGGDVAKRALDGQGQIEEADVEVVDLCLSATEKLTLYASCSPFFSPDAWLSVGVNMKHSDDASSLVLPIYTTADEPFWLFHTISKPSRIMKAVSITKIRGHWLDLQDDGSYSVINNDTVLGKNIIRTAHGPLYFEFTVNVDPEFSFHLPVAVRSVILATLRQAGLICST